MCVELSLVKAYSMCIGKGAKVAGMDESDKCFETFVNPGRVKLASWRNCRARKFSVQYVYHEIVDEKSFGCKIYNSAKAGIDNHNVGQVWNYRSRKFWVQDVYHRTWGMRVRLCQPRNRQAQNWLGVRRNDDRSDSRKSWLNVFLAY